MKANSEDNLSSFLGDSIQPILAGLCIRIAKREASKTPNW